MEKENNKVDLNIDELAFVLCNLMQNSKNWKEDIKVSEETIGFILTNKEKTNIKMFGARTKKRIEALGNIFNIIVSK